MKYTDTRKILNSVNIGFEVEFLSKDKPEKVQSDLNRYLNKKIIIDNMKNGQESEDLQAHTDFIPTSDEFKIERDFSGGDDVFELVTGPMIYEESIIQLKKIFKYIEENAWTNERVSLHINISFDYNKLPKYFNRLFSLNVIKFCLNIDEDLIYEKYKSRKNNVYCKSIKNIRPVNPFLFKDDISSISQGSYKTPKTKYYGVNFLKLEKNYLEFRYIGGKDYEKDVNSAIDMLNYFSIYTYTILDNPNFTRSDIKSLNVILEKQRKLISSLKSMGSFLLNYDKLNLLVDLKSNKELINTYYNRFRDTLYDLISNSSITRGTINYDSDKGKFEIKDAYINNCSTLTDYSFIDCELNGIFNNCNFFNCDIKNSNIKKCKIYNSKVFGSRISLTNIRNNSNIENSYIINNDLPVKGKYKRCVILSGKIIEDDFKNIDSVIRKSKKN